MCPVSVNIHLNSAPLPLRPSRQFDYWIKISGWSDQKSLSSNRAALVLCYLNSIVIIIIYPSYFSALSGFSDGVFSPLPFLPVAMITHFMSLWWVWQTQGIAFFCVMWWESAAVTMNTTHVHLCRWLSLLRSCRMHRWFATPSDFCPAAGRLENWIRKFSGLGGYHCKHIRVWIHYYFPCCPASN